MICNHRLQLSVSAGLFLVIKNRKVSIVSDNDEIVLQNATQLPDSAEFGFFPHNNGLYLRVNRQLFQITGNLQLITEIDEQTQKYLSEQTTTNEKQNDSAPEFQALEENKCNSTVFALSRMGLEKYNKLSEEEKNQVRINDKKTLFPDKMLKKHQLMNVIKLLPDYDLYMAVENNRIQIVNRDFLIIGEIKIDFDFYTGYKNPNYCHGSTSVFSPQLLWCPSQL
ncbi:Hypothetical_protein [Hexamita inflata]|uniref:Hypothetical_protein n=1 Tax=Hexamita inflata TaxID=28002 RepID=A0AA86QSC0_9EUKA|nr:Hypothetical protein HINF_LOCUS47512 [Hexamita inflata]